jgi:hypothetical protein
MYSGNGDDYELGEAIGALPIPSGEPNSRLGQALVLHPWSDWLPSSL